MWSCSVAGQYAFVKDLVDALKPLTNVDGINYWFPEEAGNGDKGSVIPSWQNRGFWKEDKSTSGHAINKTASVSATKTAADVCAPYYLGTFVEHQEQGLNQTPFPLQDGQGEAHKLLRDRQLIIRVGDHEYNASGMSLK